MRLLSELRERLGALFFRRRHERELDDELAFHLENAIEENVRRGMTPSEARRRAAIAFGGVERTKEDVRDARGIRALENLSRDLRIAFRRLTRERSFSLPAIANITLGIGVAAAVFAMVNAVLIRHLPYAESDRLVAVGHTASQADLAVTGLSPGTFLHYREHNESFDAMAVYMDYGSTVTDEAEAPEQIRVAAVSSDLFAVLRVVPLLGGLPGGTVLESGGALVSHDLWVRRYGADSSLIGRTIELAREPIVVSGIAQPAFHFPSPDTQVWITGRMHQLLEQFGGRASIGGLFLNGVGRLAETVSTETAERDLNRLMASLPGAYPDVTAEDLGAMGLRVAVHPLKDLVVDDARAALLTLLATGGFLLLITWANATNLCVLRAERLKTQIAVERALGATNARLMQRFVSESSVITVVGGVLGFAIARLAIGVRFGFDPEQVPRFG